MSAVAKKSVTLPVLAVAMIVVVSFGMGIAMFYAPNTDKPIWMPRDLGYDFNYFSAYVQGAFKPGIAVSSSAPAPSDPQTLDEMAVSMQASAATMATEYRAFAPQHGVNPDVPWTMYVDVIGNNGSPVGTVVIQWDGAAFTIYNQAGGGAGGNGGKSSNGESMQTGNVYYVVARMPTAQALFSDLQSGNYLKGALDYAYGMATGNLKWSRASQ